jgi:hypothetical protein
MKACPFLFTGADSMRTGGKEPAAATLGKVGDRLHMTQFELPDSDG